MLIMTPVRLTLVWLWVVGVGIGVAQNVENEATDGLETTRGLLDTGDTLYLFTTLDQSWFT